MIEGSARTPVAEDDFTSHSGTFPIYSLGSVTNGRAQLYRGIGSYSGRWDIMIIRDPDLSTSSVAEIEYSVVVDGEPYTVKVSQGAAKLTTLDDLIDPSGAMARLVAAVTAKRVMPCKQSVFTGWPASPTYGTGNPTGSNSPGTERWLSNIGYRPDRIFGRSGSNNAVGLVTGSSGDGDSSRGFISAKDMGLIGAALDGNATAFANYYRRCKEDVGWGLSMGRMVLWSSSQNTVRDPQIPFSGDAPYVTDGSRSGAQNLNPDLNWRAPYDYPYRDELDAPAALITNIDVSGDVIVTYNDALFGTNPRTSSPYTSITFRDIVGTTELNGNSYYCRDVNTTAKTFKLATGASSSTRVSGVGMTPYVSGGVFESNASHDRDNSHQFNHGFAWWLATGDPRAALLVQSIVAFAISGEYVGIDGISYKCNFDYQRFTLNNLVGSYLAQDLATYASGSLVWPQVRNQKVANDMVASWTAKRDAMDLWPDNASKACSIYKAMDYDNGNISSWFMFAAYGPEMAYTWAINGKPCQSARKRGPGSAFNRGPGFDARLRRAGMAEGVARRRSGTA